MHKPDFNVHASLQDLRRRASILKQQATILKNFYYGQGDMPRVHEIDSVCRTCNNVLFVINHSRPSQTYHVSDVESSNRNHETVDGHNH